MPNLLKNSIATYWVIFKQCGQMSKSFRVSIQKSRRMNKKKNGFCRPTFWTSSRFFKEQIDRDDEYGGRKCRRFYDSHGWIWLSWGVQAKLLQNGSRNTARGNNEASFLKSLNFCAKIQPFFPRKKNTNNFLAAMIYGGERYLFYGWSSPIFVPNTQYDIMTEFLRHLGTSHNNAWKMCVYTLEVSRPGNHIHNSFFVCATKLATRYSF